MSKANEINHNTNDTNNTNNKFGSLKIYTGPMFAGKTSRMINDVDRHRLAKRNCVIIRHSSDTRYTQDSNRILTHSGQEYAKIAIMLTDQLSSINFAEYDVIGIDEVQFFPDCVAAIKRLVLEGKRIICAGIDATFAVEPFGDIHILCAMAEHVEKLSSICSDCGADASFTAKISGGSDIVEVGGIDMYIPVCRQCKWTKYL